jgi:hypothetical protein
MRGVFIELIVEELKIEGKQIGERVGKRERGLEWGWWSDKENHRRR